MPISKKTYEQALLIIAESDGTDPKTLGKGQLASLAAAWVTVNTYLEENQ